MKHILIPMFNVSAWIEDNIDMLKRQTADFRCVLIDDVSTDNTVALVTRLIAGDKRFRLVENERKQYALRNQAEAIADQAPGDEDILMTVDADDHLADPQVLERVDRLYDDTGCWITYGSYKDEYERRCPKMVAYPHAVVARRSYRKSTWRASHLKTFKAHLWKRVPPEELRVTENEFRRVRRLALLGGHWTAYRNWRRISAADLMEFSGRYVRRCTDKAMMFPMLEMGGHKAQFVPDIMYIYRTNVPRACYDSKAVDEKWLTRAIREIMQRRPKLAMVEAPAAT